MLISPFAENIHFIALLDISALQRVEYKARYTQQKNLVTERKGFRNKIETTVSRQSNSHTETSTSAVDAVLGQNEEGSLLQIAFHIVSPSN